MTWHVDATLLRQYRSQQLSDARMASVEMHVTACAACRSLVVSETDEVTQSAGERVKRALDEHLDTPRVGWVGRSLRRVGVSDADAGLLAATLSLQGSWLAACSVALGFVTLASFAGPKGVALAAFLVAAPIVPLAGVALAYGPRVDPTHEIALAASVPAARVILLRTLAVTAPGLPLLVGLSFFLPGGLIAFAWLLPAIGLAAASLALGTIVPLHRVAIALAVAWTLGAGAAFVRAPRTSAETFVQGFAAFRPSGQLLFAAIGAASLVLAALRRAEFEIAR